MQRWKALVAQEATTDPRPAPTNKDFTETLAQQLKGYSISSARGKI